MFLWDSTMFIIIPAVILAFVAQMKVKAAFNKWSKVRARSGYTGAQTAAYLLKQGAARDPSAAATLSQVAIQSADGFLSDHYNPANRTLNLSPEVYQGDSIAALAIAAHETGHAFQHATAYGPLKIRSLLVPAAAASQLSWILFIVGMFARSAMLQNVAIYIFAGAVVFTLVTLPVEFNASARARAMLEQAGLVAPDEMAGVRSVLSAAALTYVAAALMAVLQLLRMIFLRRSND